MPDSTADNSTYHETLLLYYEEEVMGAAYFLGLAEHIGGDGVRGKFELLAAVERRAAASVRPLVDRYGLEPRGEAELAALGRSHVARHQNLSWPAFVAYMADRYPAYIDDFEGLERMAPAGDRPALEVLTGHEVAVIDFAERELAGDADSVAPMREYLADAGQGGKPE